MHRVGGVLAMFSRGLYYVVVEDKNLIPNDPEE